MKKSLNRTKKKNYCVDCGCSCTCDSSCNGDTKKCTSKKALKKGCNHHCTCYIGPMMKNFPKKEVKTGRLS